MPRPIITLLDHQDGARQREQEDGRYIEAKGQSEFVVQFGADVSPAPQVSLLSGVQRDHVVLINDRSHRLTTIYPECISQSKWA